MASSADSGPSAPTVASQQCGASEDARGWSASNRKQTYQIGFGWWSDHPPYHTKIHPTQPPHNHLQASRRQPFWTKPHHPLHAYGVLHSPMRGGRPYDDNEGLIGDGFGWWPGTPQILQIAPSAKSMPALPSQAISNKAATHIVRGGCAASTDARGSASNDGMGLNKGPPLGAVFIKKYSNYRTNQKKNPRGFSQNRS
jgi:hypothetical protein